MVPAWDPTAPQLGSAAQFHEGLESLLTPSGSIPLPKAWQFPWVLIPSHWGCVPQGHPSCVPRIADAAAGAELSSNVKPPRIFCAITGSAAPSRPRAWHSPSLSHPAPQAGNATAGQSQLVGSIPSASDRSRVTEPALCPCHGTAGTEGWQVWSCQGKRRMFWGMESSSWIMDGTPGAGDTSQPRAVGTGCLCRHSCSLWMHTAFSCPGHEQLHPVHSGIIAPWLRTRSGSPGTGGPQQPHGAGGAKGGDTECPGVPDPPTVMWAASAVPLCQVWDPQHCCPAPLKDPGEGTNSGSTRDPPKAGRKGGRAGEVAQGVTLSLPGRTMRGPTPTHCDQKEQRG